MGAVSGSPAQRRDCGSKEKAPPGDPKEMRIA
jgi:hypothetical protein